jgi:DNA-binding NarL/FixJ family response regulator
VTLVATAPLGHQSVGAIALAICCGDGALRARLEQLTTADVGLDLVGAVGDATALDRLMDKHRVDVALVRSPTVEQIRRWSRRHRETAFVAIVDEAADAGMDAIQAGAHAVLAETAADADVLITVQAAVRGLCVLPGTLLRSLQTAGPAVDDPSRPTGEGPLTARELEVLVAMADGASNKVIARRLGISFHTAKFHVAGILAKLDADSRTEAVTKAAQLGLVML